jgi:hypothetical protein
MDWKSFIASMVGSLAWPIVVLTLLILLRKNLGALAERIEEFSFGGAKAVFRKNLAEARERELSLRAHSDIKPSNILTKPDLAEFMTSYPDLAVIDAFRDVEELLIATRDALDLPAQMNLPTIVRKLMERQLINRETAQLFENLRRARNAAAHQRGSITPGEATDFKDSAAVLRQVFSDVLAKLKER